jgi:hypothetical protein
MPYFITTFYEVAVHHCDEKEIYEIFSPYYLKKQLVWRRHYKIAALADRNNYTDFSGKLDSRWADVFIKAENYSLLAAIAKHDVYNMIFSAEVKAKIRKSLVKSLKRLSKDENITVCRQLGSIDEMKQGDCDMSTALPDIITGIPDEMADEVARYSIDFVAVRKKKGSFTGHITEAILQRIDIFKPYAEELIDALTAWKAYLNSNDKQIIEILGGELP